MNTLNINGITIGKDKPVFIIAEIGLNHNGNIDLACRMIEKAKASGADAVKFQTFDTDAFITRSNRYYSVFKHAQLRKDDFVRIKKESQQQDICFFSTPFDFASVDLLESLDVALYKVASGDLTNIPLVKHIASKNKPIIISTGTGTVEEIEKAVKAAESVGNLKIALMHCVSNYPAQPKEMNLRTIPWMEKKFAKPIGLSDHSEGIIMPIIAAALGACIIEKHFTLDKEMEGPDHKLSTDPKEFAEMVHFIRTLEESLGGEEKKPPETRKQIVGLRRSLCAARDISQGTPLAPDMIAIKRPGTGIVPEDFDKLIGKVTLKDISKDEFFRWEDLQ